LFDPSAEAFQKSFKVTIGLLAVAIIAGLIWHFGFYRPKQKRTENVNNELGKFIYLVMLYRI
jgi:preprotein translocase subunit YajC